MSSRFLGISGLLIILGLLTGTILLGFELRQRLRIEAALRSDVAGLSMHRDLTPPTEEPLLVILGDSRAAALGTPDIPGWTVFNLGVPGQSSTEVLARAGRDLDQRHARDVRTGRNQLAWKPLVTSIPRQPTGDVGLRPLRDRNRPCKSLCRRKAGEKKPPEGRDGGAAPRMESAHGRPWAA